MRTTKKQLAIAKAQANENAQKTMHDAQFTDKVNCDKPQKAISPITIEKRTNKKSAINQLDEVVRGFNANLKAVKQLHEEKNTFLLQYFNDYSLKIDFFNIDYLFANLPEKRIFSKDNQKVIVKTTSDEKLKDVALDNFTHNDKIYYRIAVNKWTISQFLQLFEIARKNEIKKQIEMIKANANNKKITGFANC